MEPTAEEYVDVGRRNRLTLPPPPRAPALSATELDVMAPVNFNPSPRPRWTPGKVVAGRYQLEQRLATGGMGEVWRAVDRALDRRVAIKTSTRDQSSTEADKVFEEARITAHIRHPGVVMALDVGYDLERPYFVMELLEGETLRSHLRRVHRMSPGFVTRMGARLASALAHLHAHGIVHCDVKPSNVFLAAEGTGVQPKLIDFGIAFDERGALPWDGRVIGTPRYMSPELLSRTPADAAADIWSLTCLLYECLAGHPPFEGNTANDVAAQQRRDGPERPEGIHDELWTILDHGLSIDRERRFETMSSLELALRSAS